jgi:cell wall-associated NlpC family hydrolase
MSARQSIVDEAISWLGTPYHHCGAIKGAGVDCAMLLVGVYQNCGYTPLDFDPRPYSTQWHLHRSEELYLQWLTAARAQPTGTPRAGDVAVWRFGRTYSHAGILVGEDRVVHALKDTGCVTLHQLSEQPLAGRAVKYYTVLGEGV